MNDEQLRTFLLIAESGSFSKAEKESWLSKQAMMKQMKSLEEELHTALFERSHTGVKLSEKGRIFEKSARKILKEEKRLKQLLSEDGQVVRIGNVEHQAVLNPVNAAFVNEHPEISLQRVVHPNHSGEWRVANGIQDVAETFRMENRPEEKDTQYCRLMESPYMAAVSRNHPLSHLETVSIDQLVPYETMCYPIMVEEAYMDALHQAFASSPKHLQERRDVDNQVAAAYSCIDSRKVLITANPFITSVAGLKLIPLAEGWKREYGILFPKDCREAVMAYVEFAVNWYQNAVSRRPKE